MSSSGISYPPCTPSLGNFERISNEKMPPHTNEWFFPPICQARLKLRFNSLYSLLCCALRYSEFIQQSSCFEDNYHGTQPDVK